MKKYFSKVWRLTSESLKNPFFIIAYWFGWFTLGVLLQHHVYFANLTNDLIDLFAGLVMMLVSTFIIHLLIAAFHTDEEKV
jgi:hypothetical protein